MRVVLIHGMGRTPVSMWLLARRLAAAGHLPSLFGYCVTWQPLQGIVERFRAQLERRHEPGEPYAVISHSLGGVITRLTAPQLPAGLRALVMLAPPNRPPAMARALGHRLVYRLLFGDAGRKIQDPGFFARLPLPRAPTLVVAGNAGPRDARLPLGTVPNDGVVSVEETRLEGARHLEVPAFHTFLMNRRDVADAVIAFLAEAAPGKVDSFGSERSFC